MGKAKLQHVLWAVAAHVFVSMFTHSAAHAACAPNLTIVDGGPPYLDAPNIVAVFWGSFWNTADGRTRSSGIIAQLHQTLDGPYFEALNQSQYHYLRAPRLASTSISRAREVGRNVGRAERDDAASKGRMPGFVS